jgi:hypothetical protein
MKAGISVICKLTFPEGRQLLYNETVIKYDRCSGIGVELMVLFPRRCVCAWGCPGQDSFARHTRCAVSLQHCHPAQCSLSPLWRTLCPISPPGASHHTPPALLSQNRKGYRINLWICKLHSRLSWEPCSNKAFTWMELIEWMNVFTLSLYTLCLLLLSVCSGG